MEPLSTFKYIKNNSNKIVAQVISLSLGVAIIYFFFAFGGGFIKNINRLMHSPFENKAIYMANKPETALKDLKQCREEIENASGVEKVLDASINSTSMKTVLGTVGCRAVGLKKDDIKYIFENDNLKLTEGRMPENDGEILANEDYAKSKDYKLNQYIGNDINILEGIEGKKKIVGLFKADEIMVFYVDKSLEDKQNVRGFITIFNDYKPVKIVDEKYKKSITIMDVAWTETFTKSFEAAFIGFGIFIVCVMIAIEWVILNNLIYINLISRKESIALMCAVGMSQKEVKKVVLREQLAVIIIGFILGTVVGILGVEILNFAYLNPHGQTINIFEPIYLLGSICLSIVVFLTSRVPLRKFFNRTDIMAILEGK